MQSVESPSIILKVENLTRQIDGSKIIDDLSISIKKGEVWVVIGPSGAGKSTFLRLLNRLDEPQGGKIWFHDQDAATLPPKELRSRIGLVLQEANLFPGTVKSNIEFGPQQKGLTLSQEAVEQLLGQVGLIGFADRDVRNLSGGEAQRVSLARTLANSPEILLLDEPTSALDDGSKQEIEELVTSIIREKQITCLMVTHDIQQAIRIATHAMILDKGKLINYGAVGEVLDA